MFGKKKYPWNKSGNNAQQGSEKKVYAGPAPKPDPRMMECVYAGPEYFSNNFNSNVEMSAPVTPVVTKPQQHDENALYCAVYGNPIIAGNQFCHECGAPINKADE